MSHDAIVIGAGVNGLVCAHLLARAGRRVVVLERQADGPVAPETGWVPPAVVRELGLGSLTVERADPWVAVPLPDGGRLELCNDMARTVESIRRVNPQDAERWPAFSARMGQLARVLEALYADNAPDVETTDPGELLRLGLTGWRVRRMGRQAIIDLLRVLPMSAADLLDEWFASDALKGAVGALGVRHLCQGPRSGGTAFNLLHHHVGSAAGVFRQPSSNARALLGAMPGIEVRRGAAVQRINVAKDGVKGVTLARGETLDAGVVVSSADARSTLIGMMDAGWLDPTFVHAVRNVRVRGIAAEVTFALAKPADFVNLAVAPSLTYLEKAYDDAKYGRVSQRPYLEARASDGRLSVHVQYAPHTPSDGAWDDARRRALGELVAGSLVDAVPALRGTLTLDAVLTPLDLEQRRGLAGGHAYQGELALDQVLFMRPVAGWSRYRMPVRGLYLCGAGTHPGGGIAGGAGRLAARTILEDTRR